MRFQYLLHEQFSRESFFLASTFVASSETRALTSALCTSHNSKSIFTLCRSNVPTFFLMRLVNILQTNWWSAHFSGQHLHFCIDKNSILPTYFTDIFQKPARFNHMPSSSIPVESAFPELVLCPVLLLFSFSGKPDPTTCFKELQLW